MNLYKIVYEEYDKEYDCICHRTKFIEATNYENALGVLRDLYKISDNCMVIDIISMDRIAKDIIHSDSIK